jgi:hypothetical protein
MGTSSCGYRLREGGVGRAGGREWVGLVVRYGMLVGPGADGVLILDFVSGLSWMPAT